MTAATLKEKVAYIGESIKKREEYAREQGAREASSVERFNALVEKFREETKDLGSCRRYEVEELCDTHLKGEFEFNGQLGNGQSAFYNGVWQERDNASIVNVGGIKVQFYLFPPHCEYGNSTGYYVIYHVQHWS